MILELIDKIIAFFSEILEVDKINDELYSQNYIEIIDKNNRKEVIYYE